MHRADDDEVCHGSFLLDSPLITKAKAADYYKPDSPY
jgi:hypothetical protein